MCVLLSITLKYSYITFSERVQSPAERAKLRKQFADEVVSLMQQSPKTTLENLSALYYTMYKKQANFRSLGHSSMVEALKEVPNITVGLDIKLYVNIG